MSLQTKSIATQNPSQINHKQDYSKYINISWKKNIDSLINVKNFYLPYIFVLSIVQPSLKINQNQSQIKYQGVLCYQNGSPISFKNIKYCSLTYLHTLPKYFYICKQTYYLKFISTFIIDQLSIQSSYSNIYQSIHTQLQTHQHSLYQFFIKFGLISHNDKTLNRLRCIYSIRLLNKQLNNILIQHSSNYSQQYQNKQNQYKYRQCCQKQFKSNKSDYPSTNQLNNPIIKVNKIQIFQHSNHKIQQNFGGFFSVKNYHAMISIKKPDLQPTVTVSSQKQFKNCCIRKNNQQKSIEQLSNNSQQQRQYNKRNIKLAVKQLKKQLIGNTKYTNKIQHQLQIVRQIRNNQHICQYYQVDNFQQNDTTNSNKQDNQKKQIANNIFQNKQQHQSNLSCTNNYYQPNHLNKSNNAIYMESLVICLKQIISKNIFCNYLQIAKQLIASVSSLHQSGIVHRDIKPCNIMFNQKGQLKLIDFSESIQCWKKYEQESNNTTINVGFTLPYSPLQCSSRKAQGYSNMKIDNWSVGMTIIQLLLGQLPVCYCKSLANSIKTGWKTDQFCWAINLRKNTFIDQLLLPLKILCIKLMNFQSNDRLCLQSVYNYMKIFQKLFYCPQ